MTTPVADWPAEATMRARRRMSYVADPSHGPLPLLLVGLTVVVGIVDAVSILVLGQVFVANMTGNVVFVGFAVADAAGFSLTASLLALAGFLVGAAVGGRLAAWFGADRARLLAIGASVELMLFGAATVLVGLSAQPLNAGSRLAAVAVLAVATGTQNSVVRRLAVPDLTTTVLTMTLTGIAADVRGRLRSPGFARRLIAVVSMFGGAVVGAALVIHQNPATALAVGTALLAVVTGSAWFATRHPSAWRASSASA